MVKSMTGFGRARQILHGREITVEVKSVNSRYFEYYSKLPRSLGFLDDPLKKAVGAVVGRGKAEVHLGIQALEGGGLEILPNLAAANGYYKALTEIARELGLQNDLRASHFSRMNEVFNLRRQEDDEDEMRADVMAVAAEALAIYDAMRRAEGDKLVADVSARLDTVEKLVAQVEAESPGRVARYTEKLAARLQEVLADHNVEEARLLTEAAIFADKTAVDEESVRLRSHLEQFRQILAAGGQMGRKLDFLTQEINREANTIGSKCQEVEITRMVVDMKAEIEKIREQIQNLE
ncbi:MAG: YicC family protein [Ruminococcaceae bacterium]|nr:YicC family protein [Oscillospiraceae bacterium]